MAKSKKPAKPLVVPVPKDQATPMAPPELLDDLRSLIRQTREGVAQGVNSALVLLYWKVGHRIREEILKYKRAAYGEELLSTLSKELTTEFGSGFSVPNLESIRKAPKVPCFPAVGPPKTRLSG